MPRFAVCFLLLAAVLGAYADGTLEKPPPVLSDPPSTQLEEANPGEAHPTDPPPEITDWELDEASGYYWSKSEKLFFDKQSGHFYDPESDHWYDPESSQWYPSEHEPAATEASGEEEVTGSGDDGQEGGEGGRGAGEENNNSALFDLPTDMTDWTLDEESQLYWSEEAKLFFDRVSGHFYSPESGQWYDTEKEAWYSLEGEGGKAEA
jgi:hypothetical protein